MISQLSLIYVGDREVSKYLSNFTIFPKNISTILEYKTETLEDNRKRWYIMARWKETEWKIGFKLGKCNWNCNNFGNH